MPDCKNAFVSRNHQFCGVTLAINDLNLEFRQLRITFMHCHNQFFQLNFEWKIWDVSLRIRVYLMIVFNLPFKFLKKFCLNLKFCEEFWGPLFRKIFVKRAQKWVLPFQRHSNMLVPVKNKIVDPVPRSQKIQVRWLEPLLANLLEMRWRRTKLFALINWVVIHFLI